MWGCWRRRLQQGLKEQTCPALHLLGNLFRLGGTRSPPPPPSPDGIKVNQTPLTHTHIPLFLQDDQFPFIMARSILRPRNSHTMMVEQVKNPNNEMHCTCSSTCAGFVKNSLATQWKHKRLVILVKEEKCETVKCKKNKIKKSKSIAFVHVPWCTFPVLNNKKKVVVQQ